MKENTVKGEKGALLIAATALMTEGVKATTEGCYFAGLLCIAASIAIFYIREHYKFRRWCKID